MQSKLKVFTDISQLLSLSSAAKKQGRHITEADLSLISDAALVSWEGQIAWCGTASKLDSKILSSFSSVEPEVISLGGRVVLPGFVEPHTHLIFAGNRAHEFEWRVEGQTYQEIAAKGGGIRSTVRDTRNATHAQLLAIGQRRADTFVSQGVTTLEAKSGYGLDQETELRLLLVAGEIQGPKIVRTYLGAHAGAPEFADLDSYVAMMCDEFLPQVRGLAERVDIYVEKGFFTVEHARRYLRRAKDLGFQITGHVEQLSDSGGGLTALEFEPQSLDHLCYASDKLIAALAAVETTAVLLPASDLYLRMQYPRARTMIEHGVRVALSTDFNPGTSPTQNLSLVGVLARLEMKMTLPEVLVAMTLNAAYALGQTSRAGSLEVGKQCDFNVLSEDWRDLFYSIGHHPVHSVYRSAELLFSI